jgi:outer membrane protein assembly factor BamB
VVSAVDATENQWPMWCGDPEHSSASPYNVTDKIPGIVWDSEPVGSALINNSFIGMTSTPVVSSQGTIYMASPTGNISAVDSSGKVIWTKHISDMPYRTPALGPDGTVFVTADVLDAEADISQLSSQTAIYSFLPDGTQNRRIVLNETMHSSLTIDEKGTIYAVSAKSQPERHQHH